MSSALKKRMSEKQHDRVEELIAAATPTKRRNPAPLEAELAPEQETSTPTVLTVVAEAVDVLTPAEVTPSSTSDTEDVAQVVVTPKPARVPKVAPKVSTPAPGEAESSERDEPWRKFVLPPAHPGTATHTRRVNIPASEAMLAFLAARDYDLTMEKSRWVINRNELLTAAAKTYLADPDMWHATYLEQRTLLAETPNTLQGRIAPELFDGLGTSRYTQTGKRAVGPVMSFIVEQLLMGDTLTVS